MGTRSLLTLRIPNHSVLVSGQQLSLLALLHLQGAKGPG